MVNTSSSRPIHKWIYLLTGVITTLLLIEGTRQAGQWLVHEDPLEPADVIVVLSGSIPYRAEEAGNLFKMGRALEVWISLPQSPAAKFQEFGIKFVGEEEYNEAVLLHQGVPRTSIHVFPSAIVNTEGEVKEIASEMRRTGKHKVIIVTSPQHTRRVRALWKKLVAREYQATIRAAYQDPFDAERWWLTTRDISAVVREYMGLLNTWIGLTVRPRANT